MNQVELTRDNLCTGTACTVKVGAVESVQTGSHRLHSPQYTVPTASTECSSGSDNKTTNMEQLTSKLENIKLKLESSGPQGRTVAKVN